MDKKNFNALSLQDQLIILKTEAQVVTTVPSFSNEITLYSYNGYLVEEFRDTASNDLIKIETLTEESEEERFKIYGPYIDFMNEILEFQNKGERKSMAVCRKCDYEWFPDEYGEMNEIKCPICDSGSWTPRLQKICTDCNTVYYGNVGAQKRICPKCTK